MHTTTELRPSELRSICDPSVFTFKSTVELEPLDDVIGQQRAVQAIHFGLNMNSPGYNIFVTGIDGTGKATIAQDLVSRHAQKQTQPLDWCLVNNFQDEFRPYAVAVPSGKAAILSKQVQRLIENIKRKLPEVLKENSFDEKKSSIQSRYEEQERALFVMLEEKAASRGLLIQKTSGGIQPVPLRNNQPMTQQTFDELPESERRSIEEAMASIHEELDAAVGEINAIRQNMVKEIEKLVSQTSRAVVKQGLMPMRLEYKDFSDILAFLDAFENDIVENVALFLPVEKSAAKEADGMMPFGGPDLNRYIVNVLVDHSGTKGAPVIFEPNPSFRNLFGWIDKRAHMGVVTTDFSMVQAGSLLQANGGYLVLEIEPVLMNPVVWEALKRALLNKQLFIEDAAVYEGQVPASLRPEPIDLEVKIILIGDYQSFEILQNHDPKFNELFKVRADFDYEAPASAETIHQYARFVARVCRQENLRHFTPQGVAAIIEFCKKIVGHQGKLSLRFGPVVGIIKEADYWAKEQGAETVSEQHVYRAFDEYRFRYNLYEEKVHESYLDETLLIDVDGQVVGQVNALAVYQMGDISFGRPSRITAETFMGKNGVINIEREARLSGNTHDKGVMILSGYLGRTFAQTRPLCLSVSVTFEQNYNGVDGDSASSTELYAILSSLADVPIHQGIAVTGSVNQKGRIQAIGGVNQKIEGFYDVCKSRGLTGRQGVIIPRANVQNLMLKNAVIDAVIAGLFHIYPVETIEQGIQILTELPAGQVDAEGEYPEGTIYHKIQQRLSAFFSQALKWQKSINLL